MSAATTVLRRVGRYEILREIGRGGMARVYLARQTDLDRNVALKELAAFHAGDPAFVQRFLRESRVTGALSHPNIVTVHEYFEHDDAPYIAMEYFARGSLRPLVGSLTLAQVAGVLEGLLAGLAHAERHGVVHRDLKPENVMVTDGGGVKITDFGLAKALQARGGSSLTTTGATVGTPAYMAPEQASGGEIGPWTDLYALGVIAYELLAGRVPFHDEEMAVALLLRHMNEPVPPLRSVVPEVDPELAAWVERLLAKQPAQRPAGAGQAWEELEEIVIRVIGPRWRREAGLVEVAGNSRETRATLERPTLALPARLGPGRLRWAIAAVGLAAIGVGGALAGLSLTGGAPRPARRTPPQTVVAPPAPARHAALAAAGNSLFVADPRGHVLNLLPSSLAAQVAVTDAAGPGGAALANGRLYLADGQGMTVRRAADLAPLAGVALPGVQALAGGSGAPLAVIAARDKSGGRLCLIGVDAALGPCVRLGFSPTGLGSAPSGVLAVADERSGTVVLYRRLGGRLAALGAPIPVGPSPHGSLVSYLGRLYVPIERGIAVVDPRTRRRVRVIPLQGTPGGIWIVPFSGRLFVTLPGSNRVAVLDTAFPAAPPVLLEVARPSAVTGASDPEGAGEAVYVMGGDTITRLDPITGTRLGSRRLASLRTAVPTPVLGSVRVEDRGGASVLRLSLVRGSLDPGALVVRDGTIADGSAALELWQGGIQSRSRGLRTGSLAAGIVARPDRLSVRLVAGRGAFTRLRAQRVDGETILVTLTRRGTAKPPPPPPFRPGNTGSVVTTTTRTSTTQNTVAQKSKQRPKKPTSTSTTTTSTVTVPSG